MESTNRFLGLVLCKSLLHSWNHCRQSHLLPPSTRELKKLALISQLTCGSKDFTSYAIVRTLGIEHAHPVSSKAGLTITPSTPASSAPSSPVDTLSRQKSTPKQRPKNISIPSLNQQLTIDQVQPFFTTPGGRGANPNLELSGMFSPPESRTPSPPSDSYIYLDHQGTPRAEDEDAPSPSGHARLQGVYDADHTDHRDADRVAGANDQVLLRRRKGGPTQSQS